MFFIKSAGLKIVSCGNPSAYNFGVGDLTLDGEWHVLDISGVVPVGTKWAYIYFTGTSMTASYTMQFRPAGNTEIKNIERIQQKIIGMISDRSFWLPVSLTGTIEYFANTDGWVIANILIKAWLK